MHYILHRQKGRRQGSHLPPGLTDVMGDITREVLRNPPQDGDVYKFIADYLDSLLNIRQRAQISVDVFDDILESSMVISELLAKNGIDFKLATAAAKVIQDAFWKYVDHKQKDLPISQRIEFNESQLFKELLLKCKFKEEELECVRNVVRIAFRDFFRKYSHYLKTAFACGHDVWPSVESTLKCWADKVPSREKMDNAATKIQAYFRRYSVRNSIQRKSTQGGLGAESSDESLLDQANRAAFLIQKAYRQSKEDKEKALKMCTKREKKRILAEAQGDFEDAATKKQDSCPFIDIRRMKRYVHGIITAFGSSKTDDTATDIKLQGYYEMKIEWIDEKDSAIKEEDRFTYDAENDELMMGNVNRDGTVTSCSEPRSVEESRNELNKETEFCMVKVKTNIKSMIETFGDATDCQGVPISVDSHKHGIYKIQLQHFNEKKGPLVDQQMITYHIDSDQVVVEHKFNDGTVKSCEDKLKKAKVYLPKIIGAIGPWDKNIEAMKANLQIMIHASASSAEGKSDSDTDYQRQGTLKLKMEYMTAGGASKTEDEEIKYAIEDENITIEHKDKDGTITNYEEPLSPLDTEITENISFDKDAFKDNIRGIFYALFLGKNSELPTVSTTRSSIRHDEEAAESIKKENITFNLDDHQKQSTQNEKNLTAPADEEENTTSVLVNGISIQAAKASAQGLLQALSSTKDSADDRPPYKGLKLSFEHYDNDGILAEEDELSFLIDGRTMAVQHTSKDGSVTMHEEILPPEGIPELCIPLNPTVQFNQQALKHYFVEAIEVITGQKLEMAALLEPDSQTQGTFKIKVQRIADGEEQEHGIENIMYTVERGDLVVEYVDKDGNVTRKEKQG